MIFIDINRTLISNHFTFVLNHRNDNVLEYLQPCLGYMAYSADPDQISPMCLHCLMGPVRR